MNMSVQWTGKAVTPLKTDHLGWEGVLMSECTSVPDLSISSYCNKC